MHAYNTGSHVTPLTLVSCFMIAYNEFLIPPRIKDTPGHAALREMLQTLGFSLFGPM